MVIILQVLLIRKPKYTREILYQIHILDTTIANLMLQKVYITNMLVNLQGLLFTFYPIDLLLKY